MSLSLLCLREAALAAFTDGAIYREVGYLASTPDTEVTVAAGPSPRGTR